MDNSLTKLSSIGFSTNKSLQENEQAFDENVYYRSKIFTSQSGINKLITSAQSIFIILCRLARGYFPKKPSQFTQYLQYEMNSFITQARANNFPNKTIEIARLTLYKVLEDILNHNQNSLELNPIPLIASHHNGSFKYHKEPFYSILDRIIEDPTSHLDLLEFLYICLKLSYQESHSSHELQNYKKNENYINRLYDAIQNHKKRFKKNLYISSSTSDNKFQKKIVFSLRKWLPITQIIILFIFVGAYQILDLNLSVFNQQIAKQLEHLSQLQ